MQKAVRRNVLLSLSLSLCFSGGSAIAASSDEDGEAIEEVIVTGSYIRRDNFDLPSPISVTTEVDLELAGTADLGDVIFDQTFQSGVNANATPFEGLGADDQQWNMGQEVWANLRGLGTRATMTMMDSHRLPADTNTWGRRAGVDINGTYPTIAVGRIETILDGASALYGAEAVGGVINLIPKKDFEGLEISYDVQQAFDNGAPTTNLSLLAGIQGERGGAIFAIELRDQERMRYTDRPEYILTAADPWAQTRYTAFWHDAGSRSSPGDFTVPVRNANGDLQPQSWQAENVTTNIIGYKATGGVLSIGLADPGCGYGFAGGHNSWGGIRQTSEYIPHNPPFNIPEGSDGFRSGHSAYTDLNKPGNFLNGALHPHSLGLTSWDDDHNCIMSVSDFQDLQAESDANKGMAYFEYEFNDYLKFRGEIVVSLNDYNTRDVTSGLDEMDANQLAAGSPFVIGENPGNPFRAFADGSSLLGYSGGNTYGRLDWTDTNGNGLYDYGVEPGEAYIFAQDANGDGIPDRDWDGDGIADPSAQGEVFAVPVLLSATEDSDGDGIADRFDQDMLGNGGVRLFEDVRLRDQLNANPKNPRNNNVDWLHADGEFGGLYYKRRFIRDNVRLRLGGELAIPNTDWIVDADYIWTSGKRVNNYPEPELANFVKALRCQGDTNADSCWNPFSTSYLAYTEDGQLIGDESISFPDQNDPGYTPPDDPAVNTELEYRLAGLIMQYNQQDLNMQLLDVIASTGSLFDLPYNDMPVGFAIGYHHRVEGEEFKPNASNQTAVGGGKRGLRVSEQTTDAVFAELQLPLLEHEKWGQMELQLAARYSEIETVGIIGQTGVAKFDTTIPKVALRYAPTDWLAFRASMTEGFVTPGLYAMFGTPLQYSGPGTQGGGIRPVQDYLCDEMPDLPDCSVRNNFNGVVPGVLTGSAPNNDLGAETSDLVNAGFSLRLLEGDMTIDLDWTNVKFNGRVEQIGAVTNVASNQIGFSDYIQNACGGFGFAAGHTNWDNPPTSDSTPEELALQGLTDQQYRDLIGPEAAECRLQAAISWVNTDAKGGLGETGIGGAALVRGLGPNGLQLTVAEEPWVQQGEQETETLIYAMRYRFDGEQIPFIGGDYGSFAVNFSATQMLKQSIIRYTQTECSADLRSDLGLCPGDNLAAGIKVDGVGNRNASQGFEDGVNGLQELMRPLAPTPEWRLNVGLRWFMGAHTAQLTANWHDSVRNTMPFWDQAVERGLISATASGGRSGDEICARHPSEVCEFPAEAYWNASYSYNKPDFMGANWNINVAIRNLFDNMPKPQTMPAGHEGYLDNIMGRSGYVRLTMSL